MDFLRKGPIPLLVAALFATFAAVLGACFWTLRGVSRDVDRLSEDLRTLESQLASFQLTSKDLSLRSDHLLNGAGRGISPESTAALEALRGSVTELVRRTQSLESQQSALQKRIQSGAAEGAALAGRPGGLADSGGPPGTPGIAATADALTAALHQNDRDLLKEVVQEVLEEERVNLMWTSLWNTKRQYQDMLESKLGLTESQKNSVEPIMLDHTREMFDLLKAAGKATGAEREALDARVRGRWKETEDRVRALLAPEQVEVFSQIQWYH